MGVAWSCNGLLHSASFPLFMKVLIPWLSESQRGPLLGIWTTSQQVGALVATIFASYIMNILSWRYAFYGPAFLLFLMSILILFFLKESPPQSTSNLEEPLLIEDINVDAVDDENEHLELSNAAKVAASGSDDVVSIHSQRGSESDLQTSKPKKHSSSIKESKSMILSKKTSKRHQKSTRVVGLIEILRHVPFIRPVAISLFLVKLVRYMWMQWLPFFLSQAILLPKSDAGYLSMIFDIGGVLGSIAAGFLTNAVLGGQRCLSSSILTFSSAATILIMPFAAQIAIGIFFDPYFVETDHDSYLNNFLKVTSKEYVHIHIPTDSDHLSRTSSSPFSLLPVGAGFDDPVAKVFFNLMGQASKTPITAISFANQPNLIILIILVTLLGLFLAGPDSMLQSPVCADLADICPLGSELVLGPTAGIIHGLGALGAVFQGPVIAGMLGGESNSILRWSSIFRLQFIFCLVSSLILLPPILFFYKKKQREENKEHHHTPDSSIENSATGHAKKKEKTILVRVSPRERHHLEEGRAQLVAKVGKINSKHAQSDLESPNFLNRMTTPKEEERSIPESLVGTVGASEFH